MSVVFQAGQVLERTSLNLFTSNAAGNAANCAAISFAIYWVDPATETEILIGDSARVPVNPTVGEYYAPIMIPASAIVGDYRIRWTFREQSNYPDQQVVQEFGVVSSSTVTDITNVGDGSLTRQLSECETDLIRSLRILLRDNAPNRNYSFRPPTGEGTLDCYNSVFGYIWQDAELLEYLQTALENWNSFPPATYHLCTLDQVCQSYPAWKGGLKWGAIGFAALAAAFNGVADEFGYSIGGISLDIERSSKYQSLADNAQAQLEKLTTAKQQTVHYVRGLKQPRFGTGVRSAFGGNLGRNVLSPRSFL